MALQIIPGCGGLIHCVLAMVYSIKGISRVHQTSTLKSIVVNLLPGFICCCLPLSAGIYAMVHFGGDGAFKEMLEHFSKELSKFLSQ